MGWVPVPRRRDSSRSPMGGHARVDSRRAGAHPVRAQHLGSDEAAKGGETRYPAGPSPASLCVLPTPLVFGVVVRRLEVARRAFLEFFLDVAGRAPASGWYPEFYLDVVLASELFDPSFAVADNRLGGAQYPRRLFVAEVLELGVLELLVRDRCSPFLRLHVVELSHPDILAAPLQVVGQFAAVVPLAHSTLECHDHALDRVFHSPVGLGGTLPLRLAVAEPGRARGACQRTVRSR